jgi:hypothetical protein
MFLRNISELLQYYVALYNRRCALHNHSCENLKSTLSLDIWVYFISVSLNYKKKKSLRNWNDVLKFELIYMPNI